MSGSLFRLCGSLSELEPLLPLVLERSTSSDPAVRKRTAEIIARVERDGDAALLALARELDGVALESLEVGRELLRVALEGIDPALRRAMERAARNIATAHRAFVPQPVEVETEPGVIVGRRADPLDVVGVYAPGGRAAYPSSLLMGAIPARVAGVRTVIVCSPPGPNGLPSPVVLAAAALAGVDRVYAVGGAGAIAAMAYGTASIPRVNRIVGPGNAYVAEAKRQVAGLVGIDSPAGPSELLVLADETADATVVAREVIAQAEHDPRAAVVVVTTAAAMLPEIERAVRAMLDRAPRGAIAREALASRGGLLSSDTLARAIGFANRYAPEHLLLAVRDPEEALRDVRNAGTVFLGQGSSVAFGDYLTGANHVLPTGQAARSYSGLSTLDFVRWTTYQRVDRAAAARMAPDVEAFAIAEGLPAHAAAARAWAGGDGTAAVQNAGGMRDRGGAP
jgi:histidinol dehydrogenase